MLVVFPDCFLPPNTNLLFCPPLGFPSTKKPKHDGGKFPLSVNQISSFGSCCCHFVSTRNLTLPSTPLPGVTVVTILTLYHPLSFLSLFSHYFSPTERSQADVSYRPWLSLSKAFLCSGRKKGMDCALENT